MSKGAKIFGGIFLILLLGGGFLYYKLSNLERELNSQLQTFFGYLDEGQAEEAYDMTGGEFRKVESFADFEEDFAPIFKEAYESSEWKMVSVQYSSESNSEEGEAYLVGTVVVSGEEYPAAAAFYLEDSEWVLTTVATGDSAKEYIDQFQKEAQ